MSRNIRNRQRKIAQALLPHLGIIQHTAYEGVIVLDMRSLTRRQLTPPDADVLLGLEHKWQIITSIFLDHDTEKVTKSQEHRMTEPYKQADLIDYLQGFHTDQLKRERQDFVHGFGWQAYPVHRDLSEQAIDAIYRAAVASS